MKKSSRDRRVFRRLEKHLPECHQVYSDKDRERLRQIQYEALTQALKGSRFTLGFFH